MAFADKIKGKKVVAADSLANAHQLLLPNLCARIKKAPKFKQWGFRRRRNNYDVLSITTLRSIHLSVQITGHRLVEAPQVVNNPVVSGQPQVDDHQGSLPILLFVKQAMHVLLVNAQFEPAKSPRMAGNNPH